MAVATHSKSKIHVRPSGTPSSTKKVEACHRVITPEVAAYLLRRSKRKNVPVKQKKIDQYAKDMLNGRWDKFNSQAISLDWDNNIINGHQRLMACVQANVSFETLFITGVPPTTFTSEDTGRSRDAGHYFALIGEKNYYVLAAATRSLLMWERGQWHAANTSSFLWINNEDLLAELELHKESLREAAYFFDTNAKVLKGRFPSGIICALWVLTKGHPKHGAFWTELVERVGGTKMSPAWQLNRRLDVLKNRQVRMSGKPLLALLTKCWNFYATDTVKELSWRGTFEGGSKYAREPFPQPLTSLKPTLLPPAGPDNAPILDGKKVEPEAKKTPERNGKPDKPAKQKGPKLRGGLNHA